MGATNRIGTGLIVAAGLALIGLMAYAVLLGPAKPLDSEDLEAAEVAVFFPDTNSWRNFRIGAGVCEEKGLIQIVEQRARAILVRSRQSGRLVRFAWDGSLGLREMQTSLAHRLDGPSPPLAVVGSTNTALTVGLARELFERFPDREQPGPVLLVPSASAIQVEPDSREPSNEEDDPGAVDPTLLLDVYPDRTFRFCLNNTQLAELVVGLVADHDQDRPSEVVLITDGFDPFSRDLTTVFDQVIGRRFPGTPTDERHPAPGGPSLAGSPSSEEVGLAQRVWNKAIQARSDGKGGSVWVLLTTQGEPARRMLEILRAYAPSEPPGNVRVLSGDGIGRWTLLSVVGSLPFPVFTPASTSASVPEVAALRPSTTGQIEAEIVAAIVAGLDSETSDLAEAIRSLNLRAGDSHAIGRSLEFEGGERVGEDLGHVMEAPVNGPALLAHEPRPNGRWTDLQWSGDGWVPSPPRVEAGRR